MTKYCVTQIKHKKGYCLHIASCPWMHANNIYGNNYSLTEDKIEERMAKKIYNLCISFFLDRIKREREKGRKTGRPMF